MNLSGRGPPSQFSVTMRITPWMAEERKIKQVTVAYNQVTHSPLLFRSVKKHLKRLFTDFDFVGLGINKEYIYNNEFCSVDIAQFGEFYFTSNVKKSKVDK